MLVISGLGFFHLAHAAPTGGQVVAGTANIHQAGNITDIHQASQNAAINWQDFSINAQETVNFHQPSSQAVTLNRVLGHEKSVIDGMMNANGKVFIQNPNGTLIGKNAQINVGGLVATTAKISDEDFMQGNYRFVGGTGEISNLGQITVPKGGVVALIAPIVKNSGTITAHGADSLLASADSFSITLPDNTNFAYTLDKGTLQGLVDNGGAILADGGRVVLTTLGIDTVKKSLIKHSGIIEANSVRNNNGVIELLGDLDNSKLQLTGTLKAEGQGTDNGGFIETSAAKFDIADTAHVSTQSKQGKTGTWLIDPKDFTVAPSGGDTTGAKVSQGLQNNNVQLKSKDGAIEGKGDVIINDEINWDKNKLTLTADNDIHINKTLNATGTASLALEYGQGTADGSDSDYYLDKGTPLKDRTVKVNLPVGKNLSTKQGQSGAVEVYDVIHEMPKIVKGSDGEWESKFTTDKIAFGRDMDVSHTKNYEGFAGWLPYKDGYRNAKVHGLGHVVDKLWLRSKKNGQYTGLFQENSKGGFRDIGVTNVDIQSQGNYAYAGGLVGYGYNIHNSYAAGTVSTTGNYANTGGLVGVGNTIHNSYATGNVSTTGNYAEAGGLVGYGENIHHSYADNQVSATGQYSRQGGVVGYYSKSNSSPSKNTFFSQSKNPALQAVGEYSSGVDQSKITNLTGKTEAELKQKATFKDWDFDKVWRISEGSDTPRLRALTQGTIIINPKTNLGIQAHNLKKTYDGKAVNTEEDLRAIAKANGFKDIVEITGLKDNDKLTDGSIFSGKLRYDGTWKGAKDVKQGGYTIVPTGLSGGQKYEIKYGEGSLTIDPKKVSISLLGERVYDGTKEARAEDVNTENGDRIKGLLGDDKKTVKVLGSGTLAGADVIPNGRQKLVSLSYDDEQTKTSRFLRLTGKNSQNYELVLEGSSWNIKPRKLVIQAMNNFKPLNAINPNANDIGVIATTATKEENGKTVQIKDSGLVAGDVISGVKINFLESHFGSNEAKDDKARVMTNAEAQALPVNSIYMVKPSEAKFQKGKDSNYDIEYKPGKILVIPPYINPHKNFPKNLESEEGKADRDSVNNMVNLLNGETYEKMLLSTAVYGGGPLNSGIKIGDSRRFHEIWMVEDKNAIGGKHYYFCPMGGCDGKAFDSQGNVYTPYKNGKKVFEVMAFIDIAEDGQSYKISSINKDEYRDDIPLQKSIEKRLKDDFRKDLSWGAGLSAAVYRKKNSDNQKEQIFFVFRGTDDGHPLGSNADAVTNKSGERQYDVAYSWVEEQLKKQSFKKHPGTKIDFVGHSLGGGLASYSTASIGHTKDESGSIKKIDLTVFNAAQLGPEDTENAVANYIFSHHPDVKKTYKDKSDYIVSNLQTIRTNKGRRYSDSEKIKSESNKYGIPVEGLITANSQFGDLRHYAFDKDIVSPFDIVNHDFYATNNIDFISEATWLSHPMGNTGVLNSPDHGVSHMRFSHHALNIVDENYQILDKKHTKIQNHNWVYNLGKEYNIPKYDLERLKDEISKLDKERKKLQEKEDKITKEKAKILIEKNEGKLDFNQSTQLQYKPYWEKEIATIQKLQKIDQKRGEFDRENIKIIDNKIESLNKQLKNAELRDDSHRKITPSWRVEIEKPSKNGNPPEVYQWIPNFTIKPAIIDEGYIVINTFSRDNKIVFSDGSSVTLAPNSKIKIGKIDGRPIAESVILIKGSAESEVKSKKKKLKLQTSSK